MNSLYCDFCIVGAGMVGLSIANQLHDLYPELKILVLEKETGIGVHSSGRNSGVLHAGIYYKPKTIKASVCVKGAKRLISWIEERNLPLNKCGKVIVAQKEHLDKQLDTLKERAELNGATVEIISEDRLSEIIPCAKSASGRAIWSPKTAVTKPKVVINYLAKELEQKGIKILLGQEISAVNPKDGKIVLKSGISICYGHLFNCAGVHAERLAREFGVEHGFKSIPFKGLYWQIKARTPLRVPCNLYPVPDLNIPFLGIHFTPSADEIPTVSIGPTATPAFGAENYKGLEGIEPIAFANNLLTMTRMYAQNANGFRNYAHDQLLLALKVYMIKEARQLIPSITSEDIEVSSKVGIRSQLFDKQTGTLHEDFVCISNTSSTHILNAISPAFTASFELADLIIDSSSLIN